MMGYLCDAVSPEGVGRQWRCIMLSRHGGLHMSFGDRLVAVWGYQITPDRVDVWPVGQGKQRRVDAGNT